MTTTLYHEDFQEVFQVSKQGIDDLDVSTGITEREYRGGYKFGHGVYREIYFDGLHIGFGDMNLRHQAIIHFETDWESVEMHFTLKGNIMTKLDTMKPSYLMAANQHNIVYANGCRGRMEWSGSGGLQIFEVNMSPALFNKYIPDAGHSFIQFTKQIKRQECCTFSPTARVITPSMLHVIDAMINCNRTGQFKRLFLESKAFELLLLQFENMVIPSGPSILKLKRTDMEKLYAVKEIIERDFSQAYTLDSLCKQVGTNQFILKRGFKQLFGCTVFDYLSDRRMEYARHQLLDCDARVYEVAMEIGYKNPQHFTTAFKKKYGSAPSVLKKNIL